MKPRRRRPTTPLNIVKPRAIAWLWHKHVPLRMTTLIAGPHGLGKSHLALRIVADVSQHGNVIIISRENLLRETVQPDTKAAGARMSRVHFWRDHVRLPRDFDVLETEVEEREAKLVVIDPILAHTSSSIYKPNEIADVVAELDALATRQTCAILLISHTIKAINPKDPLGCIGGAAGGLAGTCRVNYLFGPMPGGGEDERVLVKAKVNKSDPVSLAFSFDMEVDSPYEAMVMEYVGEAPDVTDKDMLSAYVAGTQGHGDGDMYDDIATWLIDALKDGQRLTRDLNEAAANELDVNYQKLYRTAKKLGIVISKNGPNSHWSLPPELMDRLSDTDADS